MVPIPSLMFASAATVLRTSMGTIPIAVIAWPKTLPKPRRQIEVFGIGFSHAEMQPVARRKSLWIMSGRLEQFASAAPPTVRTPKPTRAACLIRFLRPCFDFGRYRRHLQFLLSRKLQLSPHLSPSHFRLPYTSHQNLPPG